MLNSSQALAIDRHSPKYEVRDTCCKQHVATAAPPVLSPSQPFMAHVVYPPGHAPGLKSWSGVIRCSAIPCVAWRKAVDIKTWICIMQEQPANNGTVVCP